MEQTFRLNKRGYRLTATQPQFSDEAWEHRTTYEKMDTVLVQAEGQKPVVLDGIAATFIDNSETDSIDTITEAGVVTLAGRDYLALATEFVRFYFFKETRGDFQLALRHDLGSYSSDTDGSVRTYAMSHQPVLETLVKVVQISGTDFLLLDDDEGIHDKIWKKSDEAFNTHVYNSGLKKVIELPTLMVRTVGVERDGAKELLTGLTYSGRRLYYGHDFKPVEKPQATQQPA